MTACGKTLLSGFAAAGLALTSVGCGSEAEDPTTGSISVVVTGSGAGLGLTGNLLVHVSNANTGDYFGTDNSLYAMMLEEGVPLVVPTFTGVPPGNWNVLAFLDRNGDLMVSTGDVTGPWITFGATVKAGEDSLVVIDLNAVY